MSTIEASPAEPRYRMRDLCERTGLNRQAIHFYIQRGLLPPGEKTGPNMAWYEQGHLERLLLIKRLQHERFLPLNAIKAILDDQEAGFTSSQRSFLLEVRQHLGQGLASNVEASTDVILLAPELERLDIARGDVDRMVELGLLGVRTEAEGEVVAREDLWLLESWAEVQRLGFGRELGFGVDDLSIYDEIVTQLFTLELQRVASRLPEVPADRVADMVEQALPVVHRLMTGLHIKKIRNFLASIG